MALDHSSELFFRMLRKSDIPARINLEKRLTFLFPEVLKQACFQAGMTILSSESHLLSRKLMSELTTFVKKVRNCQDQACPAGEELRTVDQ